MQIRPNATTRHWPMRWPTVASPFFFFFSKGPIVRCTAGPYTGRMGRGLPAGPRGTGLGAGLGAANRADGDAPGWRREIRTRSEAGLIANRNGPLRSAASPSIPACAAGGAPTSRYAAVRLAPHRAAGRPEHGTRGPRAGRCRAPGGYRERRADPGRRGCSDVHEQRADDAHARHRR